MLTLIAKQKHVIMYKIRTVTPNEDIPELEFVRNLRELNSPVFNLIILASYSSIHWDQKADTRQPQSPEDRE